MTPISRKEFERGELDLVVVVADFLRANSDYAYTFEEIMKVLPETNPKTEDVQRALDVLVDRRQVETKVIHDIVYYIYIKTIGFRSS